ncbi:DNA-binding protein HU-beta [Mycoplasmopsis mustelae]|uniref:DNA-binding protein HU-beta n=1 Tax=Mycoplasmopsis mustelae TaxID=171289 RepID=A0A4R7UCU3_9BACT|nr:HU family DNA-binding protein [Mycoplasmopsis mustelae]TDV24257.1 DNA-binding protein HU-beta [Mycoplasmopsis mustelae]
MTKKEFLLEVADRLESTPKDVEKVLDAMVFVLKEQLIAEDTVRLSQLGIFSTVVKKQRTIINRFTKEEQVVPQKRVIKYKSSKYLRDLVDFKA